MRQFSPGLKFKGARDYLHGTDAYSCIVKEVGREAGTTPGRLQLRLHRVTERQVLGEIGLPAEFQKRDEDVFAEATIAFNERSLVARLIETADPVDGRYPYDEDAIVDGAKIDGESIQGAADCGQSAIETLVALTKKLHYALFPPEDGAEKLWMFSGLDLTTVLDDGDVGRIAVVHERRIGVRLSRSKVLIDLNETGKVDFSLVDRV